MTNATRSSAAARSARRFLIENLNDRRLVARHFLKQVKDDELDGGPETALWRSVFLGLDLGSFFEIAIAYAVLSGGRRLDLDRVGASREARHLYPLLSEWAETCLVGRRSVLAPVREVQGAVFLFRVLDGVEAHLLSIRALEEAAWLARVRGSIEEACRGAGGSWVFSADFVARIGHYAYTAALVELTGRRRLPARRIRILPGPSLNEYAKRFFAAHLLDAIPDDLTFAEVISAGKRYRLRDGSWSTMSELVSEAATIWAGRVPFAALDAETRRRGSAALARLGVPADADVVTLHVREPGYVSHLAGRMSLRDAPIADYRDAVAHLASRGTYVVRLGDASMTPAEPHERLIDYPFTDAKSEWMDFYLASRCRFHIGTSSGMSFVPLLFGRPALLTNWITLAHMVCAPNVLTLPKVLIDRDGRVVPAAEHCARHGHVFEPSDLVLHGMTALANTPAEILDAVELMDRSIDPMSGRLALRPELFAESQRVLEASPLKIRPQIPPGFWRRHYGCG